MSRAGREVVVILWRDIPAQVNSQVGRDRHQILLSEKFQRAIDRAKRKAHIETAHEDIAQWRRISHPLDGDLQDAATAEADRIETAYSRERLGKLAFAGGWEGAVDAAGGPGVDAAELAALEELDELDDAARPQDTEPQGDRP